MPVALSVFGIFNVLTSMYKATVKNTNKMTVCPESHSAKPIPPFASGADPASLGSVSPDDNSIRTERKNRPKHVFRRNLHIGLTISDDYVRDLNSRNAKRRSLQNAFVRVFPHEIGDQLEKSFFSPLARRVEQLRVEQLGDVCRKIISSRLCGVTVGGDSSDRIRQRRLKRQLRFRLTGNGDTR